jgi:hypothetical protein
MPIADHFNKTIAVKRKTYTSDSQGGFVDSWATSIASIACRISLVNSSDRTIQQRTDNVAVYRIYVVANATSNGIKLHDAFVDSSDLYEIVGINYTSLRTHIQFDCEKILTE